MGDRRSFEEQVRKAGCIEPLPAKADSGQLPPAEESVFWALSRYWHENLQEVNRRVSLTFAFGKTLHQLAILGYDYTGLSPEVFRGIALSGPGYFQRTLTAEEVPHLQQLPEEELFSFFQGVTSILRVQRIEPLLVKAGLRNLLRCRLEEGVPLDYALILFEQEVLRRQKELTTSFKELNEHLSILEKKNGPTSR